MLVFSAAAPASMPALVRFAPICTASCEVSTRANPKPLASCSIVPLTPPEAWPKIVFRVRPEAASLSPCNAASFMPLTRARTAPPFTSPINPLNPASAPPPPVADFRLKASCRAFFMPCTCLVTWSSWRRACSAALSRPRVSPLNPTDTDPTRAIRVFPCNC